MKIGFDLTFLLPDAGGLETYANRLIRAILEGYPSYEAVAFVTGSTRERWGWAADGLDVVELPTPDIRSRAGWSVGQFLLLPNTARRAGVDILHSLGNFAPVTGSMARVVTVHDSPQFFRDAQTPGRILRSATAAMVAVGARYAHRVITDSDQTRRILVADRFARVGGRVDVIYPGVDMPELMRPAASRTPSGQQCSVLYVGTHLPHKNLRTLLRALAHIPAEERPLMTLAGNQTNARDLQELARSLGVFKDVRLLGRVSSDLLELLYEQADCLVSVSTHEGFGLPLIEAMARRVPVICSSLPVFREVAADAAAFVDPSDPRAIAQAIALMLQNAELREHLSTQGAVRARQFTWASAAKQTIGVYQQAIEHR